ncbi:PhoU domain-containing protein [Clostridium sp. UBA4548]|uniref:PhoU domain-containing protein n=1 Tax=Clostridium sp. UBA4548 TaxID=1946361 RepID=UPI0039C8844B
MLQTLNQGKCTIESGVIFLDIINHLERVADHIYKISTLSTDELKTVMATVS